MSGPVRFTASILSLRHFPVLSKEDKAVVSEIRDYHNAVEDEDLIANLPEQYMLT